jgi:uncharacterized protein GlcG (DUF336 family)
MEASERMGFGTRELAERAWRFPTFVAAIASATQGRMVPSPGGVLIVGAGDEVVGAVGISGDTGDNDEVCALAGIAALAYGPWKACGPGNGSEGGIAKARSNHWTRAPGA